MTSFIDKLDMADYYDIFKPTRNRLKKLCVWEVYDYLYHCKQRKGGYVPEVYEFIYVNATIYSSDISNPKVDLSKEMTLILKETSKLMNISHDLKDNPFGFMRKMVSNQERLKIGHPFEQIYRYYIIYSDPKISSHIESVIGIPYITFLRCAFMLYASFDKKYYISKDYIFDHSLINHHTYNASNINKVLAYFCEPYESLKNKLRNAVTYDENIFIFHAKPHCITPIMEYNNHFICLYSTVLLKQITTGMYYIANLADKKHNLNNEYGAAFENYIGIILHKLNTNSKYIIRPEIPYQKHGSKCKSSDWIIENETEIIFIECKTKKQILETKLHTSDLDTEKILTAFAAEQITKVYDTYNDYANGLYSTHYAYDSNKIFIPIILFLEDGLYIDIDITKQIKDNLCDKSLSPLLIDRFPYKSYPCHYFEYEVQLMFELGFHEYITKKGSEEINRIEKQSFTPMQYFSEEISELLDVD